MKKCFVIMPFGGYFDGYYEKVIKPAITKIDVSCIRGDEIYGTGAIINDIYNEINNSDFCIVDVTDRNPNVNYELGVAHAIGKPTIIITQKLDDVPFDYKHLRIIQYDPKQFGWQKQFSTAIVHTIREVGKIPASHQVIHIDNNRQEKIATNKHIENIFYSQVYDMDRINKVYLDDKGCTIKTSWKGISHSPVYHLCHNIVCDLPGPIEIKKAYDKLNAREMDCIITNKEAQHFTYFFCFKQLKNANQPFDAETEVSAPGYLNMNQLFETGEAIMSTQALAGGLRYANKEDWLIFPKKPKYKKIRAQYISHPDTSLVDKNVRLEETKSNYVLKLKYKAVQPYQQETAARILYS